MPKLPLETQKKSRDLFAELYVAGALADAGWHIYFPKRDFGFDFIVTKRVGGSIIIRPVQVKGKYPTPRKTDKAQFGYTGELSQLHPEMVLAIPFFTTTRFHSPNCVAYIPRRIVRQHSKYPDWYTSFPALFRSGAAEPRRDYRRFFDEPGIRFMESLDWCNALPQNSKG
jgi:hypothetical protein